MMNNKVLDIAAEWWWNVIQKPKHDNGDKSFNGVLTMTMADMLVKEITIITYEDFKNCFRKKYLEWQEKYSWAKEEIDLVCDYGPCGFLYEVAEELKINKFNFPFKTSMWVKNNSVVVSYGYRAKLTVLYATKEYWEERIESIKQSIERYKGNDYYWLTDEEKAEGIKELENDLNEYKEELKKYD